VRTETVTVKVFSPHRDLLDVRYRREGLKVSLEAGSSLKDLLTALKGMSPALAGLEADFSRGQVMIAQGSQRIKDLSVPIQFGQTIWVVDATQGG
jgi:molybdopterin converting factor small subunit